MSLLHRSWFNLPAFQSRNYQLYFAGQSLSMIGNFMTQVAILWLIYRLTNSAQLLGLAGFLGQLPVFLLAPVSGILADRYSRRRLMLLLQIFGIAVSIGLTVLTFLGWANLWILLVLSVLGGILKGLDVPIRHAFVSDIVSPTEMSSAISLNYAFLNSARLIGPAIGGILIARMGAASCFLFDSVSYVPAILALSAMQITVKPKESQANHPLKKLTEGFQYAYSVLPIRILLVLLASVSLINMSYATLLPVFAVETLAGGAETLGFLTASAASGSVIACLYLSFRRRSTGLDKLIAACPLTVGLGFVVFSFSHVFWISALALIVVGCGSTFQVAASNTVLQSIVEENKRGRVMSFYTMCFMGMAPFGNLLLGSLAQQIGAPNTLILGGGLCVLASCWFAQYLSVLTKAIQTEELSDQPV
ncbi:MAG: MFS transporter [Plectolyngbya sp. WJT66-NPBG17]|nr:MFS transporter [Plectolyngbya sp. WJT66-NPBG17]